MPVTTYAGHVAVAVDTASLADPLVELVDEVLTRSAEVDVGEPVVLLLEIGGGLRARSPDSSSSESSRSLARPAATRGDDGEHAEQHDDHRQPARQDPVDEVDDRIDQQGDDAAGDDPADRAVGRDEGVGERRTR